MRTWILAISLICLSIASKAQDCSSSKFEFGVGVDGYGILGSVDATKKNLGPELYLEYRYGFNSHFFVGVNASYKFGKVTTENYKETETTSESFSYHQPELQMLAEYMITKSGLVRPYIGVNLGGGSLFNSGSASNDKNVYGLVGPRIGVQIWHFRLALNRDYAFNANGFLSKESSYGITLGYVF